MKNLDKHEWDISREEQYAINWWEAHGYDVIIRKRFISKDYCTVSKDGFSMDYDLLLGDAKIDYKKYMQQFEKHFQLAKELDELKRQMDASEQQSVTYEQSM